jgi:para-nitrobenzyl esterase
MNKAFGLSILLTMGSFALQAQNKNAFNVQTKTVNGTIEGNYDTKSGIQTYFGVPFAAPPVGNLRWKAPQPVKLGWCKRN